MGVLTNWKYLEEALFETYKSKGVENRLYQDVPYLKEAYCKIEALWESNFRNLKDVRIVMLSEAPLFGAGETYFYNPATALTPFFHHADAEPLLGVAYDKEDKKDVLHRKLASVGFVVLDLFPFALNERDTAITYKSKNKDKNLGVRNYRGLFQRTCKHYFRYKLERLTKDRFPQFVFRYNRLQEDIGHLVQVELESLGLVNGSVIESIGGTNFSLNREKLRRIWRDIGSESKL